MSTFPRSDPFDHSPDEAMRAYLDAIHTDIEPDPMFRRRLRGTVMNRFVAEREGAVEVATPRSSRMGRLGRACLYASVATALGVGGVMAASESAIPGDFLYPLKRSVEDMRATVAPAHLRDELAVYDLAERIDELSRLIESGNVARSVSLSAAIRVSLEQVSAHGESSVAGDRLGAQLARLEDVLDRASVQTRREVERAMSGVPGFHAEPGTRPDRSEADDLGTTGAGAGSQPRAAGGSGGAAGSDAPGYTRQLSDKERPPQDQRSRRPERSQKPASSPTPEGP
jgi:hypothetical protein